MVVLHTDWDPGDGHGYWVVTHGVGLQGRGSHRSVVLSLQLAEPCLCALGQFKACVCGPDDDGPWRHSAWGSRFLEVEVADVPLTDRGPVLAVAPKQTSLELWGEGGSG